MPSWCIGKQVLWLVTEKQNYWECELQLVFDGHVGMWFDPILIYIQFDIRQVSNGIGKPLINNILCGPTIESASITSFLTASSDQNISRNLSRSCGAETTLPWLILHIYIIYNYIVDRILQNHIK